MQGALTTTGYNSVEEIEEGIEFIGRTRSFFITLILLMVLALHSYAYSDRKHLVFKKVIHSNTYSEFKYNMEFKKLPLKSKFFIVQFLEDLLIRQQNTIIWAYTNGLKYDYGYTLAAIIWKESLAGEVDVNLFDKPWGSCGAFHNNLKTVISFKKREHKIFIVNKFNLNKLCSDLQHKREFSLEEAVKVLNDARKVYKNNWKAIWAHYNGGWKNPNYDYAEDIYYRTRALKFIFTQERRTNENFGN